MSPPRVVLPSVLTGTPLGKRYPHGPCRKQWLFYFCFWWIYYLIFRGGGLFRFAGFILFVLISNLSHTIPTTSFSQSRREAALQSSLWRICSWKPLTKPISLLHQGHSGGRECSPPRRCLFPQQMAHPLGPRSFVPSVTPSSWVRTATIASLRMNAGQSLCSTVRPLGQFGYV